MKKLMIECTEIRILLARDRNNNLEIVQYFSTYISTTVPIKGNSGETFLCKIFWCDEEIDQSAVTNHYSIKRCNLQ
ncbi:hypothetical protein EZS27_035883 [termite gut metagenome]|uniref:Uncharacterized protein n=1 Tax=termite gut metagenome TaxID=433724 RepID=A0A5J4PXF3_9ZZZZ